MGNVFIAFVIVVVMAVIIKEFGSDLK